MVAFSFRLPLRSRALRWRRQLERLAHHRMGAIPTSPLLRGTTPFRLSLRDLGTQQLVRFRCLASPLATSTLLLALERLILTPRIQIRPLALQRFCLTPPAQKTRPMEQPRLNLTILASKTQPLERSLFSATPKAAKTQLTVLRRSLATPPARPTRPLDRSLSFPTQPAS